MSAPTLTDLVDALWRACQRAEDAWCIASADQFGSPETLGNAEELGGAAGLALGDIRAALPRYEAALQLAKAVDAHYPPYTNLPPTAFKGALAAYRETRS